MWQSSYWPLASVLPLPWRDTNSAIIDILIFYPFNFDPDLNIWDNYNGLIKIWVVII